MRNVCCGVSIAVLALTLPLAALADVSNTVTISSGQSYSFDTGTASTSGGDIAFTGTSITFVGNAAGDSLSLFGISYYSFLPAQSLAQDSYTSAPLRGSALATDEVFAVRTNGGNYTKVVIVAVSASSLEITYAAYGVTGTSNTPSISFISDAATYSTNAIAQGDIFVIKGIGLSGPGFAQSTFPLPTSFGGVSINFVPQTQSGVVGLAYILNFYNEGGVNQLAAVLPSSVTPGTYNVYVSYNATTGPVSPYPSGIFQVSVVAQRPGLITQDSTGYGLVVAQNFISATQLDVNRFTTGSVNGSTISPAHPGQTLIAWAIGLGLAPGANNIPSPAYNFESNGQKIQVLVGGMAITPTYAGPAPGEAGADQINFTLPANVPTGCTVPFQIAENGTLSQITYISIAPSASATACVQPNYTTVQLQAMDNGGPAGYAANFIVSESWSPGPMGAVSVSSNVGGAFYEFFGLELAGLFPVIGVARLIDGCAVTPVTVTTVAGTFASLLDAGKVTVTGPPGSNLSSTAIPESANHYGLSISGTGSTVNGNIVAGTYTIAGAGGASVGPFTVSLNISPLTVTGGLPSVVNRAAGLTINWTGGNPSDRVSGQAATLPNLVTNPSGVPTGWSFACVTTAGAQSFTVSSSVLGQLPAVASGAGVSMLSVTSTTTTVFAAPLIAGGSIPNASLGSSFMYNANPTYQ